MVFLVRRRNAEDIKKKKKTVRRKTRKNDEKEKRRIQEKSITTMNMFNFTFYIKRYDLLENIV